MKLAVKKGSQSESLSLKDIDLIGIYHSEALAGRTLELLVSPDGIKYSYFSMDRKCSYQVRVSSYQGSSPGACGWCELFPEILREKLDGINFIKFHISPMVEDDIEIDLIVKHHD